MTFRYPLPLKGVPGEEVGEVPEEVVVEEPPVLGLYLIPVAGQFDFVRLSAATNVPD